MDYKAMATAVKLCGSVKGIEECKKCHYWKGPDMAKCIPHMTDDAATAIIDLLARAETAEARLAKVQEELDKMEQLHEQVRLKLGRAMDDLRGMCWCCAHARRWDAAPGWSAAVTCKHMSEAGITGCCGRAGKKCEHWEWKGDKHVERETTDR